MSLRAWNSTCRMLNLLGVICKEGAWQVSLVAVSVQKAAKAAPRLCLADAC